MLKKLIFISLIFITQIFQVSAQTQPETAKDFFEKGLQLMSEQRFSDALDAFQQSARLDAMQASTQANIGSILIVLNRVDESIASFREAVRLAPTEASFHSFLCQSLSLTKNHSEAISQCEEGVRLKVDSPQTHIALISALRAAKRQSEALNKSEIALQKFADNEILLNLTAEANKELGNFNRVVELYEILARRFSNSAVYQVNLAESYLQIERDADSITAARRAIDLEPKNPMAHFYMGRVLFELGQHTDAAQSFQTATEIDSKFANAFYFLGVTEVRRSNFQKSIPALRQAVYLSPDIFDFNLELGKSLNEEKLFDEAIRYLQKANKLNPTHFETKALLGFALVGAAKFDEGIKALREADSLRPGNQTINMFLGVAQARKEGAAQIELMKDIAAKNSKDVRVRQSLTRILIALRRSQEAEPYIEELLKISEPSVEFYNGIAVLYADMNQNENAVEYYRKAVELKPHYVIYLSLANSLKRLGQTDEVYIAYKKAMEIKPDSIHVLKSYADFLRDEGKRQDALEIYKRAVAVDSLNSPVVYNLAALYAKTGNLELAKQYYEILKTIDPPQAKILNRLLRLK